MADNLFCVVHV